MTGFPRDDYRLLERYAPDRRPVPVDLSDNTNRWGAHPEALAALRSADADALTRYPSVYADDLRDAVARRFGVPAECVTTGCGSDDLLDSTFRAVAAGGGRVAYMDPTFSMIPIFARMNGMEAVAVGWDEAVADPAALLEPKPDVIYVCAPNNPTGLTVTAEWVEALMDAGPATGGGGGGPAAGGPGPIVLLDEAYAEFAGKSLLRRAPGTDRLLVLRTLSKAFGLAGLRVGFGVGPEVVVAEVEKSRGPYKVGRIVEDAAIRALGDPDGWVDGIVAESVENRERLTRALEERGFNPLPSRANFVFVPVGPRTTAEITAGLRARGVAVRPFPDVRGVGDGIRVTVGPWEMMERFLDALDDLDDPDEEPIRERGSATP